MSRPPIPRSVAWLRAARMEFHATVVLLFGAGAAAGALDVRSFDLVRALLAYLCLVLIQFASVLTNEHFDYAGDILTRNAGRFSGGSRVIVDGALTHEAVLRAVAVAIAALGAASGLLLAVSPHEVRLPVLVVLAAGTVLGLGYTAPPLKLSHRGLGEIDAAFTHATLPALAGWVTQGGAATNPLPWLISMPAFCAVLCARTLAGIPDARADAAIRRRTYAVIFGVRGAVVIAACAAAAASLGGVLLWRDQIVSGWAGAAFLLTIPHAALLAYGAVSHLRSGETDRSMDGVLRAAWGFTLWFGVIPLLYLAPLAGG